MSVSYNRVIVAFCEGQHDVAFLSRILLVNGFLLQDLKIGQLPPPFDKRFEKELSQVRIPDKKLGFQPNGPKLPSVCFYHDGNLIFIHNLNGDGKSRERAELVTMYKELSGTDDFSIEIAYRFLYLFDADELGIDARITDIKNEIGLEEATQLSNGSIIDFDGSEWGGYIFHDIQTQLGTLEDQLLGYFHNKSQQLQQDILSFLQTNLLIQERTKRFISSNAGESYIGRSQYYEKKSVLGMYAQLQFSGVSNAVLISNTDFLKAVDINGCQQCTLINRLFM
ncbi:hypothetical protein ACUWCN_23085 [Klebsiella pneumoniae]|uniref:hypothetical protein n=1 Tax=Klebsiella pneumoniae TaxID=573 RepID=UPI000E2D5E54|nr:hypothetical protein [Klebsiella pneumoniae]MDZ2670219.1 hypothetical protein [Klebsiella pneumoniae]MDZ2679905.1 hypothetical protein [Klebsiella pneumoniae]MDZ2801906.1 hypothetical protein [Klebsiella pneumoniae]SXW40087.1 Uncharacterised protein [Klebsiella pneumoniae]